MCCAMFLPSSYARDQTTVELKGVSLFNNAVVRGSVVFVVGSVLMTDQVCRSHLGRSKHTSFRVAMFA